MRAQRTNVGERTKAQVADRGGTDGGRPLRIDGDATGILDQRCEHGPHRCRGQPIAAPGRQLPQQHGDQAFSVGRVGCGQRLDCREQLRDVGIVPFHRDRRREVRNQQADLRFIAARRLVEKGLDQRRRPASRGRQDREAEPRIGTVAHRELGQRIARRRLDDFGPRRCSERQRDLPANAHFRIVGLLPPSRDLRRPVREAFAELHRELSNMRIGVCYAFLQDLLRDRIEPRQRGHGVNAPLRRLRLAGQLLEQRNRRPVLPLEEQARRRVAMPAVRMIEQRDQLRRRRLAEMRQRPTDESVRHDPPDSATIEARTRMQLLDEIGRDRVDRLDQLAVDVDDVETAVRPVRELARTEPVVLRRQELAPLVGSARLESDAAGRERHAMDEIVRDLADDRLAAALGGKGVAAIDRDAAGAGEEAAVPTSLRRPLRDARDALFGAGDAPELERTGPDQVRLGLVRVEVDGHRRGGRERIAGGVAAVVDDVADRVAVVADERVAPVVHRHAVLPGRGRRLEAARARVEEDEAAADVDRLRLRVGAGPDRAAGGAGREMEAIVEAPADRVQHPLAGPVAVEAGIDDLAFRRRSAFEQVRHRADEDAPFPACDRDRRRQVVDERDGLVVGAVAVRVFETLDRAPFLETWIALLVVLRELGDVESAILVEVDGDRRADERLRGDELDAEAGCEREGLDRFARLRRRHARQLVGAEGRSEEEEGKRDDDSHGISSREQSIIHGIRIEPRSLARTPRARAATSTGGEVPPFPD